MNTIPAEILHCEILNNLDVQSEQTLRLVNKKLENTIDRKNLCCYCVKTFKEFLKKTISSHECSTSLNDAKMENEMVKTMRKDIYNTLLKYRFFLYYTQNGFELKDLDCVTNIAIYNSHHQCLEDLIYYGFPLNRHTTYSVENGDLKCFKVIKNHLRKLNLNDFYIAAKKGHYKILKYMFKREERRDKKILYYAVKSGNLKVVKLVGRYSYKYISKYSNKLILKSAENGYLDIVKFLVENKFCMNKDKEYTNEFNYDEEFDYTIYKLVEREDYETLKYLISINQDFVCEYDFPHNIAAINGNLELCKYLEENVKYTWTIPREYKKVAENLHRDCLDFIYEHNKIDKTLYDEWINEYFE